MFNYGKQKRDFTYVDYIVEGIMLVIDSYYKINRAEILKSYINISNMAKEVIEKDPDVKQLEQQLADNLGAKVEINYNKKGKGKLVISYTNLDELDGILNRINQDYSHH